jgi:hypothetical protein
MKRSEEIEKAAQKSEWISKSLNLQSAFIEGANWADETMLDRACEWLRFRVSVDVPIETNENGEPLADSWIKAQMERAKAAEELIAEFRQAMEGGAE